MLTLADVKAHLKLDLTATDEDVLLTGYLASALGAFRIESKRRWPAPGEPAVVLVTDPTTVPPTTEFLHYVDPSALSADEQAMADMWILLALGHWYENRGAVAVGLNVTEVPFTCKQLMKLLREPTI